ncbi:MAG: hypothetical protein COA38_11050 [Fluviicola sp.]|nr:MAG: hypothetical protein COA38_11050 [Fluviicola sp.]
MEIKLKNILDNLINGIQIIDFNWKYSYLNEVAINHSKSSREELLGYTMMEKHPGIESTEMFKVLEECMLERTTKSVVNEFTYPDGSKDWFELKVQPISDGLLIISNDISKRIQVENELKIAKERAEENEQDISTIYNTVGNIIFKLAVEPQNNYRFVSVNHEFVRATGLSIESIIGQLVNDVIPEPSLSMVLEFYSKAIAENKTIRWEEVSDYPTGKLTGDVSVSPIYNTEGQCTFLVGAVHDITLRKQAEVLLQRKKEELEMLNDTLTQTNKELTISKENAEKSEYKIKALTEQSPIAIYRTDVNGDYTYVNKKWLEITGQIENDVLGRSWVNVVHPNDRSEIIKSWYEAVNEKMEWSSEHRMINKKDEITWVEGTATKLFNSGGDLIGYTGTNFDITDRKLAEKAVIENQRINVIGEMTSAIAHDINNSLQSISGNIMLATLQPNLDENVKRYLDNMTQIVADAAQRAKIVQRFGGANQNKQQYSDLDINLLIEKIISSSQHLWKDEVEKEGRSISVQREFNVLPKALGVEGEISAVFLNVLKNCIEAMPNGGEINIRTYLDNDCINIAVSDTGKGMDEGTKKRIFQPFFTTKGYDAGRGLGMSGAYSVLKEHGGRIWVERTELGIGTTIIMALPLNKPE